MPVLNQSNGFDDAVCSDFGLRGPLAEALVTDDGLANSTGCAHGSYSSACFPGTSTVQLRSGRVVPMSQLELGDEVAVREADGSLGYQPVYAFGHRDASASAAFVELTMRHDKTEESLALQVGDCAAACLLIVLYSTMPHVAISY